MMYDIIAFAVIVPVDARFTTWKVPVSVRFPIETVPVNVPLFAAS